MSGCVHFWELGDARQMESLGVCRHCHAQQLFSNREQVPRAPWNRTKKVVQ
jgi:hypothetical protein